MSRTEIRQVNIDSKDRAYGSISPENFWIELPSVIDRVSRIELVSAEIPYTFYAITQYNNTLRWVIEGVEYSTTITSGNYTASKLVEVLNGKMSGIKVTYIKEMFKLKFEHTLPFRIDHTCSIGYIIGLSDTDPTVEDLSFITPNVLNLNGPRYLCINSSTLVKPLLFKPIFLAGYDTLYRADIIADPGAIIFERKLLPASLRFGVHQKIKRMDFQLTDERGFIIDLNGANWSININLIVG